jgi:hypothetical protein
MGPARARPSAPGRARRQAPLRRKRAGAPTPRARVDQAERKVTSRVSSSCLSTRLRIASTSESRRVDRPRSTRLLRGRDPPRGPSATCRQRNAAPFDDHRSEALGAGQVPVAPEWSGVARTAAGPSTGPDGPGRGARIGDNHLGPVGEPASAIAKVRGAGGFARDGEVLEEPWVHVRDPASVCLGRVGVYPMVSRGGMQPTPKDCARSKSERPERGWPSWLPDQSGIRRFRRNRPTTGSGWAASAPSRDGQENGPSGPA